MPSCVQTLKIAQDAVNTNPYRNVTQWTFWLWLCALGHNWFVLRWLFVQPLLESAIQTVHDAFLVMLRIVLLLSTVVRLFSSHQQRLQETVESVMNVLIDMKVLSKSTLGIIKPALYLENAQGSNSVYVRSKA